MEANVAYDILDDFREDARVEPPKRDGHPGSRPTAHMHESPGPGTAIGASPVWCAALKLARQVARTQTTTCLQGESGTGKEVIARLIHGLSPRRCGPFVAINCAALPESLVESELFGFERGAFTGAQQSKSGQIELASGGVVFLDEVTEMPLTTQAKFLRALQERELMHVGGTRPIKVNVRVIAATNQDLRRAVAQGLFRADLYYRINVFEISIPPLRERGLDVLLLTQHFLEEFAGTNGGPAVQLTTRAQDALLAYHWPGNVRELRNVLERAAIVCEGPVIDTEHFRWRTRRGAPGTEHPSGNARATGATGD
jgi:transcriptional regulator with GAF, ATPase, and Fis domain